jgi:hypothetical protein
MNRNPKRGRPFQKGVSGNPLGAGAHNPVKKKIKRLTVQELEKILNLILYADPAKLEEIAKNNPSILKMWIASIAQHGIKKGDPSALFALLDRLVGKVPDKMRVTSENMMNSVQAYAFIPINGSEAPPEEIKK